MIRSKAESLPGSRALSLSLRPSDDVKRLFSALGEAPGDPTELSLAQLDEYSLTPANALADIDLSSFSLSALVAVATAWVAIRGYERNHRSIGWGLIWGVFGYLLPIPAVAVSYSRDVS